jgi:hypothetical protein
MFGRETMDDEGPSCIGGDRSADLPRMKIFHIEECFVTSTSRQM